MRRAAFAWVLACALAGCREEPTIVIKFEPNDLAGTPKKTSPDLQAAPRPPDMSEVTELQASPKLVECKTAEDCVVEPVDCCDCANGGKQHAIAKLRATASKAARTRRCKDVMCTMMMSTDPTCGQRPGCVKGRCVMAVKK